MIEDYNQSKIIEIAGLADMFKRIQKTCWEKCISNVTKGNLSPGEISCSDRCVSKYMKVHELVGKSLQNNNK